MMRRCVFVFLLSSASICSVLGLENLTFFGEFVVFKPATKFIKFDLYEEIDILLLEHRTNKLNSKLSDIDFLYRIHLQLDPGEIYRVNCTIYKRGKPMFAGYYEFWNASEKNNMALRWGSEKNINVLTELNGAHTNVFSWRDRSSNGTVVKYVGLAVAPMSTEENRTKLRHLNWKIREAEPTDVDIRDAYRISEIKLLSAHPNDKPKSIYEILTTREDDENYAVSVKKGSEEVMRAKTTRMNPQDIYISWDNDNGLLSCGQRNDTVPLFLWQDTEATKAYFDRIKFITFSLNNGKTFFVKEFKNESFKSIPALYPKYFTALPTTPQWTTDTASDLRTSTTTKSSQPRTMAKSDLDDFDQLLDNSK